MDFREAERRFPDLDRAYREGRLTLDQYRAGLAGLRVTDSAGRLWLMQEGTRRWHVRSVGPTGSQWKPATPPGRGPSLRRAAAVALASLASGGLCACLVAMVGLAGSGQLRLPALPSIGPGPGPLSTPKPSAPGLTFRLLETLSVAANGAWHTDARGAGLQLPATVFPVGQGARVEAHEGSGPAVDALSRSYRIETPFYRVIAQGRNDSIGRATLRLPAAGPDSRIMVMMGGQPAALLDVTPRNGFLELPVRVAPDEADAWPTIDPNIRGDQTSYAVVTPKSPTGMAPEPAQPGRGKLAAQPSDVPSGEWCSPWIDMTHMCTDATHSLYVIWASDVTLADAEGLAVARGMQSILDGLRAQGFTNAWVSRERYLIVRLQPGGHASYWPFNANIYLPLDIARDVAAGRPNTDLAHEMAHWLQDEVYNMAWAYWSGGTWWMEVSAENVAMLGTPSYVGQNLIKYGRITLSDESRVYQYSPYQWPDKESYVMAQMVKLNMCDDAAVCPISEAGLAQAISEGSYPFDQPAARQKMSANLDDYVRYLLGVAPVRANKTIPLDGVRNGASVGEYLHLSEYEGDVFSMDHASFAPQAVMEGTGASRRMTYRAVLQAEGVYPVYVSGAQRARQSGMPAMVRVEPGVEVWYRVDGGEIKRHDGSGPLIIAPVHNELGLREVRMVAVGRTGGEVYQARVSLADPQGAWLLSPLKLTRNALTCTSSDPKSTDQLPPEVVPGVLMVFGALGDYRPFGDGTTLNWALNPARVPKGQDAAALLLDGKVTLGTRDTRLRAGIDIPRKTTSLPGALAGGPVSVLAAAAAAPAAYLGWQRRRRWLGVLAVIMLMAAAAGLLSGCAEVYGKVSSDAAFTRMEYVGGDSVVTLGTSVNRSAPQGLPLWQITGTATYQADLTFAMNPASILGSSTSKSTSTCRGTLEYEVSALVYKDVIVEATSK